MFLCFVFALFGCEKITDEEKEEWNDLILNNYSPTSSWFYGYRINDPSGFGRHPLIEKLSDSTQIVIKEGLVLVYNSNFNSSSYGIRILSYKSLAEEAELLRKEIEDCGSTMSQVVQKGDGFDWISGVKNGKGWIGKADRKTRKVINEWTDGKEVEQDIKVDLGYGNYKTIHMDRLAIGSVVNIGNDYLVTTVGYNNGSGFNGYVWYKLYVLSDNKTISIPLKHSVHRDCSILPWYKNSFLVFQDEQTSTCYSLDGKLIDTFKGIMPYYNVEIFPCSYSDYINISGNRISRETLSDSSDDVWYSYYEPLSQIPSNSKVTYTLLSSTTDIWEFKADVLNYDGSKKSLKFKVNIETGEVTD